MILASGRDSLLWWDWIAARPELVWSATVEHLVLTGIALGVGFAISIVLASVALRFRRTYAPIAGFAGVLYAIPSLALFAFFVPITGLSILTAQINLVSYTLLILVRNIVAGIDGVPPAVKEAADAMGYTPLRRFLAVDLRLATPAIVAGLRIATVTTVGLVTVTFLVGYGGYGGLINDGLSRRFNTLIVVGAGLSILLAVILDLLLVVVERLLTPWSRARR